MQFGALLRTSLGAVYFATFFVLGIRFAMAATRYGRAFRAAHPAEPVLYPWQVARQIDFQRREFGPQESVELEAQRQLMLKRWRVGALWLWGGLPVLMAVIVLSGR